jgi:hypothetical protein
MAVMQASDGWTWEATATIIQALATVVALTGVAVTFFFSYRAERRERMRGAEEAKRADAAAERSERAAALSIDTMERIAEAIENLAAKEFGRPSIVAPAPPARVRWALTHFDGHTYMLQNIGNATAYRVQLSADETLLTPGTLPDDRALRPDDSVTFLAVVTFATRDTTITVEWSDDDREDAAREVWRYPLPPRPPRG